MIKEAEEKLLAGDYVTLAEFYEEAIATNPEEITNYWYLSLAYLLQEKEEEAQSLWLSIFERANEAQSVSWLKELINILDQQATKIKNHQNTNYNTYLAWLIRRHIKELAPNYINNRLILVSLEIILQYFQPQSLEEWEIITLLQDSTYEDNLDKYLLLETLFKVLEYPDSYSILLAEKSLELLTDFNLVENILAIAKSMVYARKNILYGLDLAKVCFKAYPDNLKIAKENFWLNFSANNLEEALFYGEYFLSKAQSLTEKIFANYQLLYLNLKQAEWDKVVAIADIYKKLIAEIEAAPGQVKEDYIKESIIVVGQPLLYLEDNPAQNRPLQNKIAKLFQNNLNIASSTPRQKAVKTKLKIGYIGHTLKSHSVGWLSRWLFYYHNREAFEIAIYLINQVEDHLTQQWFKPKVDIFHNLPGSSAIIIEQIIKDEIDILVDLDSLTLDLTCKVLAAKPAPLQVTWLGLDASGLASIDYFIADQYVLPENAQDYYQETIWRLPNSYVAVDGFEVGVPTRRREDLNIPPSAIIYLIIQAGFKRHPDNIHSQMRIIKAVENSYLLIKGWGDRTLTQQLYTRIAASEGVNPERLRFLPQDQTEAIHRANLAIADVVLDTYPYNGATTTLEVLWMGIPLVTRVGEQFAARNSYTFMINAGLSEGIAYSESEYIEWGIRYGHDQALREQVSYKLKWNRTTSPLWNARQFTREMESAYQQMWAKYEEK